MKLLRLEDRVLFEAAGAAEAVAAQEVAEQLAREAYGIDADGNFVGDAGDANYGDANGDGGDAGGAIIDYTQMSPRDLFTVATDLLMNNPNATAADHPALAEYERIMSSPMPAGFAESFNEMLQDGSEFSEQMKKILGEDGLAVNNSHHERHEPLHENLTNFLAAESADDLPDDYNWEVVDDYDDSIVDDDSGEGAVLSAPNGDEVADDNDENGTDGTVPSDVDDLDDDYDDDVVVIDGTEEIVSSQKSLVIINSSVLDADKIIAALGDNPNVEILRLESGSDALQQILDYLNSRATGVGGISHEEIVRNDTSGGNDTIFGTDGTVPSQYSSLQIVSHGNTGYFVLNGQVIDAAFLADAGNAEMLRAISAYFTNDADMLLYGCNLAGDSAGQDLVNQLSAITGMDVAASIDTTGAGGNWTLEYVVGTIETANIVVEGYEYELAGKVFTVDNTAGKTFADAIADYQSINTASYGDYVINFALTGGETITVSEIALSNATAGLTLTIDGSNSVANGGSGVQITLSGNNANRVFNITAGDVTLQNLTITGGNVTSQLGSGILTAGAKLTLNDVTVSGNNNTTGNGAGIYVNGGNVTINRSTISGNTGQSGAGLLANAGTLTINDSFILNNIASGTGNGGGIYINAADVTLSNTVISGNTANGTNGGGGICVGASGKTVYINDCTITNNIATSKMGGGIQLANGNIELIRTTISGNSATTTGGGINVGGATSTLNVVNSTITGNSATTTGGGISITAAGTVNIANSTITGNIATTASGGGGINRAAGTVNVLNSIIVGNYVTTTANDINSAAGVGFNMAYSVHGMVTTGVISNGVGNTPLYSTAIAGNSTTMRDALQSVFAYTSQKTIGATANLWAAELTYSVKGVAGAATNAVNATPTIALANTFWANVTGAGGYKSASAGFDDTGALIYKTSASWARVNGTAIGAITKIGNTEIFTDQRGINQSLVIGNTSVAGVGSYWLSTTQTAYKTIGAVNTVVNTAAEDPYYGFSLRDALYSIGAHGIAGTPYTIIFSGADFAATKNTTITLNAEINFADVSWIYQTAAISLVNKTVMIDGGVNNITLQAGNNARVFNIGVAGNLTLNNLTITGNLVMNTGTTNAQTNGGGGILISNADANVTLNNSAVNNCNVNITTTMNAANNNATAVGGGIYVSAGNLTLNNSSVSNNTVTITLSGGTTARVINAFGGGIYFTGTNLTIDNNSTISTNSVTTVISGATGTITQNINGGGIYVAGGAVTVKGNSTIGGEDAGNSATNGGGIFINAGSVTLDGANITYNSASNSGGGIRVSGGTLTVQNKSNISNNTAISTTAGGGGLGGGIFSLNAGTVTIDDSTISGNTAQTTFATAGTGGSGGGILAEGGLTITNSTITGNHAIGNDPTGGRGGGIAVVNGSTTVAIIVSIQNTNISSNDATGNGGGIFVDASGNNAACQVTLNISNNTTINGNSATLNGGGIYIAKSSIHATANTVVNITSAKIGESGAGNSAASGAGIYLNAGTLKIDGAKISYNVASANGGGIFVAGAGALQFINNATTLAHNSAANGGGLYLTTLTPTVNVPLIINNNSASQNGGGVYVASGTLNVKEAEIKNNTANVNGAGFYVANGALHIVDSEISGNIANKNADATGDGGGIYLAAGAVTIANNDSNKWAITGNSAVNGGGIFVNTGSLKITTTEISNNEASANGGGIYLATGAGAVNIVSSLISNNYADADFVGGGDGGGIYVNGGIVNLTTSTIFGNSAINGGGFYFNGGVTNLISCTVAGNQAGDAGNNGDGGGIFVNGGTINVLNSIVLGNIAVVGGDDEDNDIKIVTGTANLVYTVYNVKNGTLNTDIGNKSGVGFTVADVFDGLSLTKDDSQGHPEKTMYVKLKSGWANQGVHTALSGNTALYYGDNTAGDGVKWRNATGADATLLETNAAIWHITDQRGYYFANANGVSYGAYWLGATATLGTTITVNSDRTDIGVTNLNPANGMEWTLNSALQYVANYNGTATPFIINFHASIAAISLTAEIDFNSYVVSGATFAGKTITIDGYDAARIGTDKNLTITIAGVIASRIFNFNTAGTFIVQNLNLLGNNVAVTANSGTGGAILITTGAENITLNNVTISNCKATNGGAIYQNAGILTINDSTIKTNTATTSGGGIYVNAGKLDVNNSTISGNTASGNASNQGGGGFYIAGGTVNIANSTINANVASGTVAGTGGGGFFIGSAAVATVTIQNSTIHGNTASSGGGIRMSNAGPTVYLINCTIAANIATVASSGAAGGGGIFLSNGGLNILNSIVVGNYSGNTVLNDIHCNSATVTAINLAYSVYNVKTGNAITEIIGVTSGAKVADVFVYVTRDISGRDMANLTYSYKDNGDLAKTPTIAIRKEFAATAFSDGKINIRTAFDTDTNKFYYSYNGTAWNEIFTGTATGVTVDTKYQFKNDQRGVGFGDTFSVGSYWLITGKTNYAIGNASSIVVNSIDDSVADPYATCATKNYITLRNALADAGNSTNANVAITFDTAKMGTSNIALAYTFATMNFARNANPNQIITINGGDNITISTNGIRVFAVDNAAKLTLSNITLSGTGTVTGNGGAININHADANVTLNKTTINGFTASLAGGGIYIADCATVKIENGSIISNNTAVVNSGSGGGGGIRIAGGTSVIIDNSIISGNKAHYFGGGIYLTSATNLQIIGGSELNTNQQLTGSGGNYGGGGLYANNANAIITITGAKFIGNTVATSAAASGGGAIFTIGAEINITNSTFTSNTSGNSGGAIYVASGKVSITGGTITKNTANASGGGIHLVNGTLTISGVTIGATGAANTANTHGGGIYVANGTVEIKGKSTISNNTATTNGGGLLIMGGATASVTIDDSTIENNTAGNAGGAIRVEGTGTVLTIKNGSTISGNKANMGGGIATFNTSKTTIENSTITKNEAITSSGGGIHGEGTVTITDSTVSENIAATTGGGINTATANANLTLNNVTIDKNIATTNGGGIYIGAGTLNDFVNTKITNNEAVLGGGIYTNIASTIRGVKLDGNDLKITGNIATGANGGGGIYIGTGAATIANAIISGNNATTGNGGGINVAVGGSSITNVTISGNTAQVNGGGIVSISSFTITDCKINNNIATTGSGGGISITSTPVITITNSEIKGNTASVNGGGISSSGTLTIRNSTIGANGAANSAVLGGGIYFTGTALTLDTLAISYNTATDGAGIYVASGATVNINNSTLNHNAATGNGGGLYFAGTTLNLTVSTIYGNSAASGAGIYHNAGIANILSCTITANNASAASGGGGVFVNGGTVNIMNTIALGNNADSVANDLHCTATTHLVYVVYGANTGAMGGVNHNNSNSYSVATVFDTGTPVLANNGGETLTVKLNAGWTNYKGAHTSLNTGNVALWFDSDNQWKYINAGVVTLAAAAQTGTAKWFDADQRELFFNTTKGVSFGAYWLDAANVFGTTITVNSARTDTGVTNLNPTNGVEFTLSRALQYVAEYNATNFTILFAESLGTTLTLAGQFQMSTYAVAGATFAGKTITIDGGTGRTSDITLQQTGSVRIFEFNTAGTFVVKNVNMQGTGTASNAVGGAIVISNAGANITLDTVTLNKFNSGTAHGGGINMTAGTLTINNSTISNNSGNSGGGIITTGGTLNVINSTFSGNVASGNGGAIFVTGIVNILNTTITGNYAGNNAATPQGGGGICIAANTQVNILNSIVVGNYRHTTAIANDIMFVNATSSILNIGYSVYGYLGSSAASGTLNYLNNDGTYNTKVGAVSTQFSANDSGKDTNVNLGIAAATSQADMKIALDKIFISTNVVTKTVGGAVGVYAVNLTSAAGEKTATATLCAGSVAQNIGVYAAVDTANNKVYFSVNNTNNSWKEMGATITNAANQTAIAADQRGTTYNTATNASGYLSAGSYYRASYNYAIAVSGNVTYNGAAQNATANPTSGGTTPSGDVATFTLNGFTNAGIYTQTDNIIAGFTVMRGGTENVTGDYVLTVAGNFTIKQLEIVISQLATPTAPTYGDVSAINPSAVSYNGAGGESNVITLSTTNNYAQWNNAGTTVNYTYGVTWGGGFTAGNYKLVTVAGGAEVNPTTWTMTTTVAKKAVSVTFADQNNTTAEYGTDANLPSRTIIVAGNLDGDVTDFYTLTTTTANQSAAGFINAGSYNYNLSAANAMTNYLVSVVAKSTVTHTIAPKAITVTGLTVNDREYNGVANTSATVNNYTSLNGVLLGDTVAINSATSVLNFADGNADVNKNVTITNLVSSNNNYTITTPAGTFTANITQRQITVTANNAQKTVGAADPATFDYTVGGSGLASSDNKTNVFSGALVREIGEEIKTYDILMGTLAANNNYNITTFTDGVFTITVKPVPPAPNPYVPPYVPPIYNDSKNDNNISASDIYLATASSPYYRPMTGDYDYLYEIPHLAANAINLPTFSARVEIPLYRNVMQGIYSANRGIQPMLTLLERILPMNSSVTNGERSVPSVMGDSHRVDVKINEFADDIRIEGGEEIHWDRLRNLNPLPYLADPDEYAAIDAEIDAQIVKRFARDNDADKIAPKSTIGDAIYDLSNEEIAALEPEQIDPGLYAALGAIKPNMELYNQIYGIANIFKTDFDRQFDKMMAGVL